MPRNRLHDALVELDQELRVTHEIEAEDRALLEQVQAELAAVLRTQPAAPHVQNLRDRVRHAVEQVQARHPALSRLMTATLDALSDLGI